MESCSDVSVSHSRSQRPLKCMPKSCNTLYTWHHPTMQEQEIMRTEILRSRVHKMRIIRALFKNNSSAFQKDRERAINGRTAWHVWPSKKHLFFSSAFIVLLFYLSAAHLSSSDPLPTHILLSRFSSPLIHDTSVHTTLHFVTAVRVKWQHACHYIRGGHLIFSLG